MKKSFLPLVALLAASVALPLTAAAPAKGKKPPKPETVVEATADTVLLPAVADGILVVKACQTCVPQSYRVTASSVYRLAGKPLSLAELKVALAKNPRMNIDISVSPQTREIQIVEATPQGGKK